MRSLHIQKDKTVFDFQAYPAEEFAASLGLPGAPQIKLQESKGKGRRGNRAEAAVAVKEAEAEEEDALEIASGSSEGGASEDEASEDQGEEDDEEDEEEEDDDDKPVSVSFASLPMASC